MFCSADPRDVFAGSKPDPFKAAKIHGRLQFLRVPADAVGCDLDDNRRLARLAFEGCHQPLIGQQGRLDPSGQVLQRRLRLVRVGLHLSD